jgi:hypothetical protein
MSWDRRFLLRLRLYFASKKKADAIGGDVEALHGRPVQYRLEASRNQNGQGFFKSLLTCGGLFCRSRASSGMSAGINPNQKLAMYLHWMFRVNFVFLFVVMCITFFGLVILFSGIITLAGHMDTECVRVGGKEFDFAGAAFADAFSLSWTTFSTVGYGTTYPALGKENSSPTK